MTGMSPMCPSNWPDDIQDQLNATVSASNSMPYRSVIARWNTAMKLFPADFFMPKDPDRFRPANPKESNLFPELKIPTGNDREKASSARVGRPPSSESHSYRQQDLEMRLRVAGTMGAPFRTINSLAEYLGTPETVESLKRHIYEYAKNGTGLGIERIEFINHNLREHGWIFEDYDISKVPIKKDWVKDYDENELPVYRNMFIKLAIKVSLAVIELNKDRYDDSAKDKLPAFPSPTSGWDSLDVNDVSIRMLRHYGIALAEGFPRGSVESWVWWLAYEKLVKGADVKWGQGEMMEAHDSILKFMLEPISSNVPITRLQVVLGSVVTMP
jgi:hypothetical protein